MLHLRALTYPFSYVNRVHEEMFLNRLLRNSFCFFYQEWRKTESGTHFKKVKSL